MFPTTTLLAPTVHQLWRHKQSKTGRGGCCEGVLERWAQGGLTLHQASGLVQDPKVEVLLLYRELEGSISERSWSGGDDKQTTTTRTLKYWQGTDIVLQNPPQLLHACGMAGYFHEIRLALQLSRTNTIQTFYTIYVRMQRQNKSEPIRINEIQSYVGYDLLRKIFLIDPVIMDTAVS